MPGKTDTTDTRIAAQPLLERLTERSPGPSATASTILDLRSHVRLRWNLGDCKAAVDACGRDLEACEDWLKRARPGTGPQAPAANSGEIIVRHGYKVFRRAPFGKAAATAALRLVEVKS